MFQAIEDYFQLYGAGWFVLLSFMQLDFDDEHL